MSKLSNYPEHFKLKGLVENNHCVGMVLLHYLAHEFRLCVYFNSPFSSLVGGLPSVCQHDKIRGTHDKRCIKNGRGGHEHSPKEKWCKDKILEGLVYAERT